MVKKKWFYWVGIGLPILVMAVCIVAALIGDHQASMSFPMPNAVVGTYSYDGEHWYPLEDDSALSAYDGELVVKGHLEIETMDGGRLYFYRNHIGMRLYVNGELYYTDTPSELMEMGEALEPSMCGRCWTYLLTPAISSEDEVEIHLVNFHRYGNKNAYRQLLDTMYLTGNADVVMETYLDRYRKPFYIAGAAILIVGIMMLGAFLESVLIAGKKTPVSHEQQGHLLKQGLLVLMAGGYIWFDTMRIFEEIKRFVFHTYALQLCMMLAVYYLGLVITDGFRGKKKRFFDVVMGISCGVTVLLIALAAGGVLLLFDTQVYWAATQIVLCVLLLAGIVHEWMKGAQRNRFDLVCAAVMLFVVLLELAGVGTTVYDGGICAKTVFSVLLLLYLFRGIRQLLADHRAALKNQQLEKELEDSRIAVMMSQIQPHFLYNSLSSVMDLCDRDPREAKQAIADFADYLRGNLTSLKVRKPIPFRTELKHIERYLRLEKLRFQEELNIVYDIQTDQFVLPALSVQPLVENAVLHGLGEKDSGGTVTIRTKETDQEYVVEVMDDGVGFAEDEYRDDKQTHIGLQNIRSRLKMMMNASLTIHSEKGKGTTAVIRIPKGDQV